MLKGGGSGSGLNLSGSRQGPEVDCREHDTEHPGSVRGGELVELAKGELL
jgi:hypothetical protein